MNEEEKYLFDLNGYLVIKDVLASDEIALCNQSVDQHTDQIRERVDELSLSGGSEPLKGITGRGDLGGMLTWPAPWCKPFRSLLDHPSIVPYLLEVLRDGLRLDHLYGIITKAGAEGHTLHGGGTADDFTHFYQFHNGRMRCGLTVVSWALTDVGPGDGGFMCIPGSHKANYVTPPWVGRLEKDIGVVKQIEAPAGSAIIFTEALTHGTKPWKATHERRSILYKYSPGPLTYGKRYVPEGVEEADVFALAMDGGQSCMQVFFYRSGQNWGTKAYYPKHERDAKPEEIVAAFLVQFYDERPPPKLILTSHEPDQNELIEEALALRADRKIEVRCPVRGGKRELVMQALNNAKEALSRKLAETASQTRLLDEVRKTFDLEAPPRRIEVYDNSHIQGSNAVGGMVVAGPEGFEKNQYRKFNIKDADLEPGDDYGMMREVMRRRFSRLMKEAGITAQGAPHRGAEAEAGGQDNEADTSSPLRPP